MVPVFDKSTFPAASGINDRELAQISAILARKRNFSLSGYKSMCMKRRVAIRIRATHCRDTAEYLGLLLKSEQELDLLQKVLTIHVSQFFRNPSLFEKLRWQVLPELFATAEARADKSLRIWCLGCAGGEEPYSLAILLKEYFTRELRHVATTITGTDIDTETLVTARGGSYGKDRLRDVSPVFLKRYFQPHGERFHLTPEIRDMVTFTHDNITNVDCYIPNDMVLCRNTLIYFTRPEQENILNRIAEILPAHGILVLGKSETLGRNMRRRFASLCPIERIYRKIA
jgi:chemotaxis protein methyltransferase CheR